ncbi:MAG: hypothetical protein HC771_03850 [Synechococcales cyanobacterium CRU_2_2]|nr:hypothetical protein [Synechococcales cyanobacterium CRU_2_2]
MSEGIEQMNISTLELKFLLKLLGLPGYRGPMNEKLTPGEGKGAAAVRDNACRSLCSKGIVAYRDEIKGFSITPTGKELLKQDTAVLPISPEELKVLEAAKSCNRVTPGNISKTVPSDRRQALIRSLSDRGLLKVSDRDIKLAEAWLTSQGKNFIRQQYSPGENPKAKNQQIKGFSMADLGHLLDLLRQPEVQPLVKSSQEDENGTAGATSVAEILEVIARLNRQYDADNYLPIFYLREQVALEREELDRILYQLQNDNKIELDTLQEAINYSESQISAGIPQPIGGPLFFISLSGIKPA